MSAWSAGGVRLTVDLCLNVMPSKRSPCGSQSLADLTETVERARSLQQNAGEAVKRHRGQGAIHQIDPIDRLAGRAWCAKDRKHVAGGQVAKEGCDVGE